MPVDKNAKRGYENNYFGGFSLMMINFSFFNWIVHYEAIEKN
jgi:hypothetical protein